jgi:predicted O-linked N-acetylglucosamine transferase (SPINDLY family)
MPTPFQRKGDEPSAPVMPVRDPAGAATLIEAGIAAEASGNLKSAERLFRQAVEADPDSAPARMNLGIVLQESGNPDAAAVEHSEAVRLDPQLAHAHYNLALARLALGQVESAEAGFRDALRARPEFPEAWVGLADALESAGRDQEALAALDAAIAQRPAYVGAIFNAGALLRRLGRQDEAEDRLRGVPEGHPDSANAMTALAATLRDQGRIEEAVDAMRAVVEALPDSGVAQAELLFTLGFSDRISDEGLFAEHLWAGCRAEAEVKRWCADFPNPPDPERILNVGYLSGDFRGHSVSLFTEFLFDRHRRNRVRVFAYSSTAEHDAVTARFIAAADGWRDLREQPDATAARTILDDKIDILVDLSGYTSNQRIGILAGRAAPVQMTWLGYINTTGLTRVDYRITDPIADPPGMTESLHTERLLRMPHSQWCFRPPAAARDAALSRDASAGAFTFGAFNQFPKVSDSSIALWIGALRAAPGTRLRAIGVPRGKAAEALAHKLTEAKIDASRFDLVERVPLADYYAEHGRVDACLDTTPYSGGTTTCDALWMGVPVITLAGTRSMSRSSASLLAAVGRPDLVARTPQEFFAIAAGQAAQGAWQASARADLRERLKASPLMDEVGFTADLEDLYRSAWREWCGLRTPRVL